MKHKFLFLILGLIIMTVSLYFHHNRQLRNASNTFSIKEGASYKQIERYKLYLIDYDSNKDGYLSKGEYQILFKDIFQKMGNGSIEPWTKGQFIERFNEEIKDYRESESKKNEYRAQAEKTFENFDVNGDGDATLVEFFTILLKSFERGGVYIPEKDIILVQKPKIKIRAKNK